MAENPLAIRVSEEIKALFNELAEQGEFENKGEFLNRLLILYQSESTKQDVSMMKPAIETVETLTTRLLEVLNGTAAAITTNEEKYKQELAEQKKSFEETRMLLQQRITSLEQDRLHDEERIQLFIQDKETAEAQNTDIQNRIKSLEQTIKDKQALIDEYRQKNDDLSGVISQYKTAAAENKNLTDIVNKMKQVNEQQQRRIDELTRELQQQADTLKFEQENLKKSLLLDKDAALLELKVNMQNKLEEQQAKHSTAISEYENKVKDLLTLLEKGKTIAPPANKRKAPANKKTATGAEQTEPTTTE